MASLLLCPAVVLALLLLVRPALGSESSGQGLALVEITENPGTLFESQSIILSCTIDGGSDGNFTWFRNGVELTSSEVNVTVTGNHLMVSYLTVAEWNGACIRCRAVAMTAYGSSTLNLTVASPSPTFLQHPKNMSVNETANFTLSCPAIGLPPLTITLHHSDGVMVTGLIAVEQSAGVFLFTDATGEFTPGDYFCRASNDFGQVESDRATIKVYYGPVLDSQPDSDELNFTTGDPAMLNCSAKGFPPPTISWTKDSEVLAVNNRIMILENGTLNIISVNFSDVGLYTCIATNEFGGSDTSDDVMIYVFVQANIIGTSTEDIEVNLGEPVVFYCNATAVPAPYYVWNRVDGDTITGTVATDNRVSITDGNLNISMATRSDGGCYKCTADNELNTPDTQETAVCLTVYAVPLPPDPITVTSIDSSWISISWPSVDTYPSTTDYHVEYKLGFHDDWMTISKGFSINTCNITDLYPNAQYEIRIISESPAGRGDPSPILSVDTLPGLPGNGVNSLKESVQLDSNTSDSLTVSWTVPEVLLRTSYVGTYLELVHPNGTTETVLHNSTEVTFTDLTPATDYSLNVTFIFVGDFMTAESSLSESTQDGVPDDAPTITDITALSSTQISISWLPPSSPNGNITSYTILVTESLSPSLSYPKSFQVNGSESSSIISGLMPYTEYIIFMSANTSAGQGPSANGTVRTLEGVPPAPEMPEVFVINSTSLRVSWTPLSDEAVPGILVNYTIKYNQLHHGHSPRYQATQPTSNDDVLVDLQPYTVYKVSVAAATDAGLGNFSEVTQSRTFGDRPVAVVTLEEPEVSCPAGLRVQWAELNTKQLHGPAEDVELVFNLTKVDSGESEERRVTFDGNMTTTVFGNLSVFTNYSIIVAVANANGTGPYSQAVYGVTCDGVAPPPNITQLEAVNSTAIRLAWQQLDSEDVPGMLVNYSITYTLNDNDTTLSVPPESSEAVLPDLTPYTNYTISIASVTRYEFVSRSSSSFVRTLGDRPIVQLAISMVTPICDPLGLMVAWNRPMNSELRGPLEDVFYRFEYSSGGVNQTETTVSANDVQQNGESLSYLIKDGIVVNVNYSISVSLGNANGTGPPSEEFTAMASEEAIPSRPEIVTITPTTPTSLNVMWAPSANRQGTPQFFLYYTSLPQSPPNFWAWSMMPLTSESRTAVIDNLSPFTNYYVIVSANTSCGTNQSFVQTQRTLQDFPSAPRSLRVTAALPTSVTIRWEPPTSPNGVITMYKVYCPRGTKELTVSMATTTDKLVVDCSNLEPQTSYTIAVSAVNGAGESRDNGTVTVTTACEDSDPKIKKMGEVFSISVGEKDESKENCTVRTPYILIVVQVFITGTTPTPTLEDYNLDELINSTKRYNMRRVPRQADSTDVYIAANISEAMLLDGFMLGRGESEGPYTNHRLQPGHSYNVALMSQVSGTDTLLVVPANNDPIVIPPVATTTEPTDPTSTEPAGLMNTIIIAASAGAGGLLLLLICLTLVCICCCKCCSRSLDKVETTGGRLERGGSFRLSRRKLVDPIESFRNNHRTEALEEHPPIPVMGFLNKLAVMQTNDNQLFFEEFGSIDMNPQYSTDVANLPLNRAKNRYNNILPYDHSRVKLSSYKHSTDYINANYCSGYMKPKTYIATQGPIPESISDFWRMVWEMDSRSIVMLTNPTEKGKVKCEVYWPREVGASSMHGNIEVTLTDMTQLADYTIRSFTIHKGGTSKEPRELRQFHFTSWPDHGVPQYATPMLSMLRRVKAWHPPSESGPVIVHCSAGVGRSGTYIVIDTMLERLKNGDELIDIYGHVSLLRTQRPFMVQTEDQYFFIHEAVAEALLCGNTEVGIERLHGYLQELCSLIPEDEAGHTHMELQFKRLALERNDPNRFLTATKDANKAKNRYVNVLPYENNRVCLEFMRGVDGSDYINASHVDSYHTRRAFIATQGPLPGTMVDFWRMVWQYNSPVIVMLTECIEKGTERSACYWPVEVRTSQQYDKYIVEMTVERNSTHYSYRDLYITNTESQQRRLVRQFQFHSWPEMGVPSNPMVLVEFIREVQKLYTSLNTKAPLIIHCSNGVGRTGVFIALHIILERMLVEGLVDVFQTVKNLRIQRPAMLQSLDQYHFCYDATVDYIETTDMTFNLRQRSQSVLTTSSSDSKRKHRPSVDNNTPSRSPAKNSLPRRSGSVNRSTPARTESFKGSARNLDLNQLGNGASQIYGGSDGTSTFGNHRNSGNTSPPPNLSSSQVQLNTLPQNGKENLSQALSQPLSGSQPQLHLGGGSQPQLNLLGGGGSQQSGVSDGIVIGVMATNVQFRGAPVHQLAEAQRYSTTSTNRSSTGEA